MQMHSLIRTFLIELFTSDVEGWDVGELGDARCGMAISSVTLSALMLFTRLLILIRLPSESFNSFRSDSLSSGNEAPSRFSSVN
jgi:hypothetical protein